LDELDVKFRMNSIRARGPNATAHPRIENPPFEDKRWCIRPSLIMAYDTSAVTASERPI
jgi:hypothetical protein